MKNKKLLLAYKSLIHILQGYILLCMVFYCCKLDLSQFFIDKVTQTNKLLSLFLPGWQLSYHTKIVFFNCYRICRETLFSLCFFFYFYTIAKSTISYDHMSVESYNRRFWTNVKCDELEKLSFHTNIKKYIVWEKHLFQTFLQDAYLTLMSLIAIFKIFA